MANEKWVVSHGNIVITGKRLVCVMPTNTEQHRKDALDIVRAVNTFSPLLAALKEIIDNTSTKSFAVRRNNALAAISEAETA